MPRADIGEELPILRNQAAVSRRAMIRQHVKRVQRRDLIEHRQPAQISNSAGVVVAIPLYFTYRTLDPVQAHTARTRRSPRSSMVMSARTPRCNGSNVRPFSRPIDNAPGNSTTYAVFIPTDEAASFLLGWSQVGNVGEYKEE